MPTLSELLGYGAQGYNMYQTNERLNQASNDIKSGFNQARTDVQGAYQPYVNFGLQNIQGYKDLGPFSYTGQDMYADPSYDWRFQQGQKALERTTAKAPQGFFSGQTLADITNYGQNAASQEYQAAFDRAKGTYDTNKDYYGFGVTTGAKAAGEMGTNLGDIAIGRGGSLASLHGSEAALMNRQLNALAEQLGGSSIPSQNAGALSAAGGKIVGAVKDAAGKLFDIDSLGNIFDAAGGSWLGNFADVAGTTADQWIGGSLGSLGGDIPFDYGSLFAPTTTSAANGAGLLSSLFNNPPMDPLTNTIDYAKLFDATAMNGEGLLNSQVASELGNQWVNDTSWWDDVTSTVSDWGNAIKDFFL
jgi:hypothetical protein